MKITGLQKTDTIHSCLYDAIVAAGVEIPAHIHIPTGGVPIEGLVALCAKLDIEPHNQGTFTARVGEPLIFIYRTRPGWAHAEFTTDGRKISQERNVIAVLRVGERK